MEYFFIKLRETPYNLRSVATDGHRLAQYDIPLPQGAEEMTGIILFIYTLLIELIQRQKKLSFKFSIASD